VAIGFDPNLLANYYFAKLPLASSQIASFTAQNKPTQLPPWDISIRKPAQEIQDVAVRKSDPYFDPKDQTLTSGTSSSTHGANSQIEALLAARLSGSSSGATSALDADNDKMFALYKALSRLDYIAQMANRDGTVDGQRLGLNTDFQSGLGQVLSFVHDTSFSNLNVLPGQKTSTAQSTISIPYPASSYQGGAVVGDKQIFDPVPGVMASNSFTISVTKAGVKTDVVIDLANVSGPLTLDNINAYVNQQLAGAGFATRFGRVQTGGSIADRTATWGEKIDTRPGETITLSSSQAKPSVYIAGVSGKTADAQGKLIKLTGLDTTPASAFADNIAPDSGTASAKATVVDANGNVYVLGDSTGSFGSEVNQGTQDVYLTKYDSAGNVQWTKLLGAAGTASGFGLAVDPKSGGVVISGSVTGDLTPTAIGSGTDSFVAKYDAAGNQLWLRQVAPATTDQANSVSVDSSGNVYVGGQVNGGIGSGQISAGGTDAYVTKLDSAGKLVYQRQFGTTGTDAAARTAVAADGNLLVASVQNGHAILTKYSSADNTTPALWQIDLGDLQGGSIGGLAVANGQVYVSGTTANASLNANVAHASAGGAEAFVFAATDSGGSANTDFVSYSGTAASDQGGGVAAAGGKIYLTGTTSGTFAGQTRNVAGTHNIFVTQMAADGTVNWTQQYGGLEGESRGLAIAADDTGSSVLDALKLPRGKIDITQSNAIESQTTARAGDYFTLAIKTKTTTRKVKITIGKGETLRSLATKINGALLFDGKATALPVKGGQGLKIAVNEGVELQLISGPKDFDALAGLGLKQQLLTKDVADTASDKKTDNAAKPAAQTAAQAGPQVVGLGINGGIDLLNKQNASHAHVVLQGAMALIKQAYSKLNNPTQPSTVPAGSAPGYMQTQLAGYQTALAWLNTLNGG
jgi:hypothetical protein